MVKQLIKLNEEKLSACRKESIKIMASMKEMQDLIASYQSLM